MQRMAREVKSRRQGGGPARFDKLQIQVFRGTIDFIADDKVPERGDVNPDLVCPARDRSRLKERKCRCRIFKLVEFFKMRECLRSGRMDDALEVDLCFCNFALPDNRGIDAKIVHDGNSIYQSEVAFLDFPVLHRHGGTPRGGRVFCDEHETARFPVEPVDQRNLAAIGNFIAKQILQRIPECAWTAWFGWVHEQARRFVDGNQVGRFTDDLEVCLIVAHVAESIAQE